MGSQEAGDSRKDCDEPDWCCPFAVSLDVDSAAFFAAFHLGNAVAGGGKGGLEVGNEVMGEVHPRLVLRGDVNVDREVIYVEVLCPAKSTERLRNCFSGLLDFFSCHFDVGIYSHDNLYSHCVPLPYATSPAGPAWIGQSYASVDSVIFVSSSELSSSKV